MSDSVCRLRNISRSQIDEGARLTPSESIVKINRAKVMYDTGRPDRTLPETV